MVELSDIELGRFNNRWLGSVVIVFLMVGLGDIELGRFNNRWLNSVVIVWLRVWLIDVELGRFDNSASGVKTEAPPHAALKPARSSVF